MEVFNVEIKEVAKISKNLKKLDIIEECEYFSFRESGHFLRILFKNGNLCLYRSFDEISFIYRYLKQHGSI